MQNLKVSLSDAMNYLGIPETERESYRAAIEGKDTMKTCMDDEEDEEKEDENDELMFIP